MDSETGRYRYRCFRCRREWQSVCSRHPGSHIRYYYQALAHRLGIHSIRLGLHPVADISELHAYLNPETKAIEFYNGSKGNVSVMPNFEFSKNDNPDAIFSVYNVAYCGIIEDPHTFQYSYWSSGSSIECILAGNYMQSLDRIMLIGQKSNYNSTPEYGDVYWSGLEATLGMGSMSTSQIWTPVQVVRPECRFNTTVKSTHSTSTDLTPLSGRQQQKQPKQKAPARFTATTSTKSLTAKVR